MNTTDDIDYQKIIQAALRDVVRRVLAQVAEQGMPGDHHFYIGFRTDHPEVRIPKFLTEQYPTEMTIILQHQFWELEVTEEDFSVLLTFNARRHGLTIPFAAVTAFADPVAEFALRFDVDSTSEVAEPEPSPEPAPAPRPSGPSGKSGDVIRFDPSRRK